DLTSSDSTIEKQRSDFDGLVELIHSDEFLLDHVDNGIYVKERRLYEENGKINAFIKGIFKELKEEELKLRVDEEEIVLTCQKDDDVRIESDGKILETENNMIVTWPKTTNEIYFKFVPVNSEKKYSMIEYFREWNAKY
ncbi:MAG: hypothetical protein L0Y76_02680, partial [Ignavibacteria bacterium]|nr:hypothetical protein [Ignavibacteria bacterium]